jgi:hypothetical protein
VGGDVHDGGGLLARTALMPALASREHH